ncbi:MAG TPA: hypothetical protein VGL99_03110 [Chloroflexota bacterium]|jgi:hypothetical protein
MTPLRVLVLCVGLVIALAPMAAVAADDTADHMAAELANASAQYQLALQQADDINAQTQLNMSNDRMIALLQSEALRQHQLDGTANGNAIEQITRALANAARADGEVNARNELGIAQIRAGVLIAKADSTLANAMAQGRQDEILNAQAQSSFLHRLADTITSVMAEQNMSNARLIADARADMLHTPGIAAAANGTAMGANDLLAADVVLAAGQLNATSESISGSTKAATIISHAAASLKNAQAMASATR